MPKEYYGNKKMKNYDKEKYKKGKMGSGYMDMIYADHSKPSNLPQEVIRKTYPPCDYLNDSYLDDSYRGIDDNINDTVRKIDRHRSDSMY